MYGEFDVVVVGGGPAGLMAAAAAARRGRSTILLERYGFLGGAGTAGGLSTFCGLHAKVYGEHRRVIHGLADELLERLAKLDGLAKPHLTINDGITAQAFDISSYKIAADELVVGSGARILFHTLAVGVVMADEDTIDAVLIESKSGRAAVRGRMFVDASGDGDVAAWAGVRYEKSPTRWLLYPSLMFRINGVDAQAAGAAPWRTVERLMEEAERAGTHRFPRKKPIVRPQRNPLEWRANLTQLSNPDGSPVDGTDVDQLTHGELTGRQQVLDAFTFIRDHTPGFEPVLHRRPRAPDRHPRDQADRRALPAHRGRRTGLRGLPGHDRRQRLAGRGTRRRYRGVPLAARGGPQRVQPAAVPDDRAGAGGQPVRRRSVRVDDPRRPVLCPGHRPLLRHG